MIMKAIQKNQPRGNGEFKERTEITLWRKFWIKNQRGENVNPSPIVTDLIQ